jgi:integrase/recombinase XerD
VTTTLHPAISAYLDALRAADQASTAATNAGFLRTFAHWLAGQALDVLHATPEVLRRYQHWLAAEYRTRHGEALALSTQATAIIVVKALYRWLHRRDVILIDPAATLVPPKPPTRVVVAKDYLSLQEATALIDTCASRVAAATVGTTTRALRLRDLAAISLALATGRRCHGLCDLLVAHLDAGRNELRVEREKGKAGRVLPIASWAVAVVRRYLAEVRTHLLRGRESDYLLVSQRAKRLCERGFAVALDEAIAATITSNPDLIDLPAKRISSHSLRVTFAVTLFANGCGIRSLNDLMLHANLTTTAHYTPIPLEDLRRVLLASHPRA